MATSYKPLNPEASPYHKTLHPYYFYTDHHFSYHILLQPQTFFTYNVCLQPSLSRKALPPPPSRQYKALPPKIRAFSLTPVPCGPRGRCRRVNKVVHIKKDHQLEWRPKVERKETEVPVGGLGFGGRRRWKNRTGEYQETLEVDSLTSSLMIKNIPNKYTRKLMIQTLDNHCKVENEKMKGINEDNAFVSAYDFLYLPIDFHRRVNAGFAFVNFTNPQAASRFRSAFDGKRWDLFDSPKIAEISRARIQGKESLIDNCKKMDFTYGSEEDMPVSFDPPGDGSKLHSKMHVVGKYQRFR